MTPPAQNSADRLTEKTKQDRAAKSVDKTKDNAEKRRSREDKDKATKSASATAKDASKTRSGTSRNAEPTPSGSTNCPARAPEIQNGGDQNKNNDMTDLSTKIDQLFTLVGGLSHSIQTLQSDNTSGRTPPVKRRPDHDLSDGEVTDEYSYESDNDFHGDYTDADEEDDDNEPPSVEHYDPLASLQTARATSDSTSDFDAAVAGLTSFFQSNKEITGDDINGKLADALNISLRLRPVDASVNELTDKYPYPGNIPNLKVPKTNTDISTDLWKSSQYLDLLIQKCQLMTSKALIPILRLLDDITTKPKRRIQDYQEPLHDTLRLLAACFNSLSQARKDVIRTSFHDTHVSKLCTWDTPVGEEFLFDFDVVAKVDTLTKSKGLRATLKKKRRVSSTHRRDYKRSFPPHSGHSGFNSGYRRSSYPQPHTSRDYYRPSRPSYNPRKPFLGKPPQRKGKNHKSKDRQ